MKSQNQQITPRQQKIIFQLLKVINDRYIERIKIHHLKQIEKIGEQIIDGEVVGTKHEVVFYLNENDMQHWRQEIEPLYKKFMYFQKFNQIASDILDYLKQNITLRLILFLKQQSLYTYRRCIQGYFKVIQQYLSELKSQSVYSTKGQRQNADMYTCPITMEIMKQPVDLPCGHCFQQKAIFQSLQKQPRCPMCRQSYTTKDIRKNRLGKQGIRYFIQKMNRKLK